MARKVKLAINWAAACGGCDVSILDLEAAVLELAELVEFVYWPVAMDFKREDLRALAPGSIELGLFNGAVRTTEQEEDALLLRERCQVLVAYGSCACFGGIPGLANVTDAEGILATVYGETASTDNPERLRPQPSARVPTRGGEVALELPALCDAVRPLHQVVDVDLFLPGCPPPAARIAELVAAVREVAGGGAPPPRGSFLASDRALCEECPRNDPRGKGVLERFVRPHEVVPDPDRCLLDQGIACAGIATRGGCGASCIAVNMPCRGCLGPLPGQHDPAAELVSALAALAGPRGRWEQPIHQIVGPARGVVDPLGTHYRFTYPVSIGRGTRRDGDKRGA
jgi:F420-non-reducing hydrogenase small subunit